MDPATVITVLVIAAALLAVWLLPTRKRWNDDGAADEARRQGVERELVTADIEEP